MPKCPKCKKKIDMLMNIVSGWNTYKFDGVNYDLKGFDSDDNVNEYRCPLCDKVLFTDENTALNFLGFEV